MMVMMRNLQQSLSLANEHIQGGRTNINLVKCFIILSSIFLTLDIENDGDDAKSAAIPQFG